jgi:quercetin dioxygenase-like cupin family protein
VVHALAPLQGGKVVLKGKVAISTGSIRGNGLAIANVSTAVEDLNLKNAVHISHSTGGRRAARYVSRYFSTGQAGLACWLSVLLLSVAAAWLAPIVVAQGTIAPGAKVSVIFDQELPNVPGKSMRAVLVEYAPGAGSPSHRHPSSAFIFARVLEGAIRSKVNDEAERTYQTGEFWTEKPGDHHQVSKNASATEPAKLLAIFVVDTSDRQIVTPDK